MGLKNQYINGKELSLSMNAIVRPSKSLCEPYKRILSLGAAVVLDCHRISATRYLRSLITRV